MVKRLEKAHHGRTIAVLHIGAMDDQSDRAAFFGLDVSKVLVCGPLRIRAKRYLTRRFNANTLPRDLSVLPLFLSGDRGILHDGTQRFDPRKLAWTTLDIPAPDSVSVSPAEAVLWLYEEANARMVPIGVIGPRQASERQIAVAEQLGRRLGELRIPLLNGGKNGVMEAVSKGCVESGGLVLGFVPDEEWTEANDFVTIPLATGLGPARNVLIARASLALVAIGGEYGTLSEMAFGLHFDKPVFTLEDAPEVDGAQRMESVEDVMSALLLVILQLPRQS